MTSSTYIRFLDNELYDFNLDSIELNLQLNDLKNISQSKSSFTVPVFIPYTPTSIEIFGNLFNINNQSSITQERISAKLIQNNKVIIDGYVYVDKTFDDGIDIIIASGDLSIFEELGTLLLTDLNLTGETYNNREAFDYYTENSSFDYSTITGLTHQFININWYGNEAVRVFGQNNERASVFTAAHRLTPVIRTKLIFDEIISQRGYTYDASDEFLNKLNQMFMTTNAPIQNYTNKAESYWFFNLSGSYYTDPLSGNIYPLLFEQAGSSKSYNRVSEHTSFPTSASPYNHYVREITPFFLSNTEYNFTISFNGYDPNALENTPVPVKIFLHTPVGGINNVIFPDTNENDIEIGSFSITGTSIFDSYSSTINITPTLEQVTASFTSQIYPSEDGSYYVRVEKESTTVITGLFIQSSCNGWLYDTGHTYTLQSLLSPTYKQYDMLNDILTMFNMYIYADPLNKKHLHFQTFDDFYNDEIIDWSQKITFKGLEKDDLQKQLNSEYQIGFKPGDDLINKSFKDTYEQTINTKIVKNEGSKLSKSEINKIELSVPQNIFSTELTAVSTYNQKYPISSLYTSENSKIVYGFLSKYDLGFFMPIQYYALGASIENLDYTSYKLRGNTIYNYLTLSPFIMTGNSLNEISDPQTFALQFDTQDQYLINYDNDIITNRNLYTEFFGNELNKKINGDQKYLKIKVKLNENDVNVENFKKLIWIDNNRLGSSYYRLSKIVYSTDPSTLSDVELISETNYTEVIEETIPLNKIIYNPTGTDSQTITSGGSTGTGGGGQTLTAGNGIEIISSAINIVNGNGITGGTIYGDIYVDGNIRASGEIEAFFGTSGTSGTAGSGGTSGTSGTSGSSGSSGATGSSGSSGAAGSSGTSGSSGSSGTSGSSGVSGTSGSSGSSGTSGSSGSSGTSPNAALYAPLANPVFTGIVTIPETNMVAHRTKRLQLVAPGPNAGEGKWYIRLHPDSLGTIGIIKITVNGSYNYAPINGYLTAELTYRNISTTFYEKDFRITSTTGDAHTNLRIGDVVAEGGYISIPVWCVNTDAVEVMLEWWDTFDCIVSNLTTTTWVSEVMPSINYQSIQGDLNVTGNVGIGTTSPLAPLHIHKDGIGADAIGGSILLSRYYSDSTNLRGGAIFNYYPGSANQDVLAFAISSDTTPVDLGKVKMVIGSDGNVGIGTTAPLALMHLANIGTVQLILQDTDRNAAGEHWYLQSAEGNLYIGESTAGDGSWATLSDKITVLNGGNVGIGTTAPFVKLSLGSDITQQKLAIYDGGTSGTFFGFGVRSGYLDFQTLGSTKLTIAEQGNVGIGTTVPASLLHLGSVTATPPTYRGTLVIGGVSGTSGPQQSGGIELVQADANSGYGMKLYTNSATDQCGIATRHNSTTWTERLSIATATGNVGIGNIAPAEKLHVTGNIIATGEVTSYYSSDERLKRNIQDFKAIELINKLNPKTYNWNDKAVELNSSKDTETTQYGLIAQDVEKVLPEVVHKGIEDYKSIDYMKLIPILIQGMKEQQKQIDDLKNEINYYKNYNT